MGRLIRGDIPSFFQGVSRQPHQVRAPGQVQDMLNAIPTVVTGGFEKRPGSQHKDEITGIAAAATPWWHSYNRDHTEQYLVFIEQHATNDPVLRVWDIVNFTEKTVAILDSTNYYARNQDSTTLVTGSDVRTYKSSTETQIDLTITGVAGGLEVKVYTAPDSAGSPGSYTLRQTFTTNTSATVTMEDWIRVDVSIVGTGTFTLTGTFESCDYLRNATDGMGFSAVTIADYTLMSNNSIVTRMTPNPTAVTTFGPAQDWVHLPRVQETVQNYLKGYAAGATWVAGDTGANTGDVWKVQPDDGGKDAYYYATLLDDTASVWEWEEAADPNSSNSFEASTLPHQLIRLSDGTFTFGPATWDDRESGDTVVMPDPDFIGATVDALTYYRNRLGIIADETAWFSQNGDYFDLWGLSATQVVDTDAFGLTATAGQISLLKVAVPFRRALFLSSAHNQFEISGDNLFTPARAAVDFSTTYDLETAVTPIPLGDTLYFPVTSGERTLLFEYFYDDSTVSNTANEVTIHCQGYIPDGIKWMTGSAVQKQVICAVDDGTIEELYFYSYYWKGREKVQESWHKWQFQSDTEILYAAVIDDPIMTLVLRRTSGEVYIEQIDLSTNDIGTDDPFNIRLDQRVYDSTGSYNAGTDQTTFTLPYEHDNDTEIRAILSNDYGAGLPGTSLSYTFSGTNDIIVSGDYSTGAVIIGRNYDHEVELSIVYWRQDNKNITDGRLQLKDMVFDFEDTAYFEVEVTPETRTARTHKFNGATVGGGAVVGSVNIESSGTFRVPIRCHNEKATIKIKNNTYVPSRIVSATWRGFFNEYSRQESTPRKLRR